MKHANLSSGGRQALTILSVSLLVFALLAPAFGQAPQDPQQYPAQATPPDMQQPPAAQPLMPPAQLDNLVAPIALYPDPLLGQVLAASTYPLEVVEAGQFVQQNSNLHGQDLMNAARQQNWDPSVQALVAFPDVLTMLTRDVRWMNDLGNAFLAQQQDVMAAVQRLRTRAQANGRLQSNAQQTVTDQTQNGQNAVVIEPANPGYIDVPEYNPAYVWGPPAWGYYPALWYPPISYGFGFYPGIYLGGFFPGWGFGGWGAGWGWGCGWFGGGLFVNAGFFSHWGFHGYYGSGFAGGFGAGRLGWQHDPFHRAGVPYANRSVAARFNSSPRFAAGRTAQANSFSGARANSFAGTRSGFNGARSGVNGGAAAAGARGLTQNRGGSAGGGGWQHFGGNASGASRGFAGNGGAQSFRGNGGTGFNSAPRSFASPGNAAPRSYNSRPSSGGGFSAPRSSGGGGFSAPRSSGGGGFSGGRSFGGGGGGHSFGGGGGGGHSGGGGHGGGRR
jgi:hypothetical protein